MDAKTLFTGNFNERVVNCLPMRDPTFLAKLTTKGLFLGQGDLKEQIAPMTSAMAATRFITELEKRGKKDSFETLLLAMKEYGGGVTELAEEIEKTIKQG